MGNVEALVAIRLRFVLDYLNNYSEFPVSLAVPC